MTAILGRSAFTRFSIVAALPQVCWELALALDGDQAPRQEALPLCVFQQSVRSTTYLHTQKQAEAGILTVGLPTVNALVRSDAESMVSLHVDMPARVLATPTDMRMCLNI